MKPPLTRSQTGIGYDIEMWAGAEAFLLIFCSCVPTLSPLWDRFVTKKLDSSYGRTPLRYTPNTTANSKSRINGSFSSEPYSRLAQSRNGENVQMHAGSLKEAKPTYSSTPLRTEAHNAQW